MTRPSQDWSIDDGGAVATVQDENGQIVASFHGAEAYRNALRFIASFDMVEAYEQMMEAATHDERADAEDRLETAVDLAQTTYADIDAEDETLN